MLLPLLHYKSMPLALRELSSCLGVEVQSVVDLTQPLPPFVVSQLQAALDKHGVLVLRSQPCSDAQHVRFALSFGAVEAPLPGDPAASRDGEPLFVMSNVDIETGQLIPPSDLRVRYADGNALWHSDGSFRPDPLRASLLSAKVVPPSGQGATEFASLTAAYAALSPSRQAEIDGLEAEFSLANSRRQLKTALSAIASHEVSETKEVSFSSVPPVRHPIVRVRSPLNT